MPFSHREAAPNTDAGQGGAEAAGNSVLHLNRTAHAVAWTPGK